MRTSRLAIAVILLLFGLFWIGQGSGVIPGSLMSGSQFWEIVGVVLVIAGVVVGVREWTSRPKSPQ